MFVNHQLFVHSRVFSMGCVYVYIDSKRHQQKVRLDGVGAKQFDFCKTKTRSIFFPCISSMEIFI